jgi:hypothetical protein
VCAHATVGAEWRVGVARACQCAVVQREESNTASEQHASRDAAARARRHKPQPLSAEDRPRGPEPDPREPPGFLRAACGRASVFVTLPRVAAPTNSEHEVFFLASPRTRHSPAARRTATDGDNNTARVSDARSGIRTLTLDHRKLEVTRQRQLPVDIGRACGTAQPPTWRAAGGCAEASHARSGRGGAQAAQAARSSSGGAREQ